MSEIILKFCLGLAILLFSTQKLVRLAEKISRIFRISPLVVGITVVAIGTSLPELAVSAVSIAKHDTGLAMGNIIGSNIVNVLMVLPVGLFIGKFRIGTTKTQRNALFLLGVTAIFFLTQFMGTVKYISGAFLVGLAILISVMEYKLGILGRTHEDSQQFKKLKNERLGASVVFFGFLLVLGIIGGSVLIVDSVEKISRLTGVSTTILGLTLIAVATSLPELLTTILSQEDGQEKITVGNILGSNIYNLLLVGGIVSLFPLTAIIQAKEWVWLAVTTIGFVFILRYYKGQKPPKWIGLVLLLLFLVYLLSQ
ncbi:MAG: sodium:calcium antiporter [Candidatus Shapirobacteria bacterium]